MSKKELYHLKQRIKEIAGNIKEQEAYTTQVQDRYSKFFLKHSMQPGRTVRKY